MKVEIVRWGDWSAAKRAAYTTIGKEAADTLPSAVWRRKLLRAQHSPIRALVYEIVIRELPYWVSVHLVRHKFGVEHFVSTQRDDRTDNPIPRADKPQGALVTHRIVANAAALIAISRKRLCSLASPETRAVWTAVRDAIAVGDSAMAWAMRPECWWCGDLCPEMRGCGKCAELHGDSLLDDTYRH